MKVRLIAAHRGVTEGPGTVGTAAAGRLGGRLCPYPYNITQNNSKADYYNDTSQMNRQQLRMAQELPV